MVFHDKRWPIHYFSEVHAFLPHVSCFEKKWIVTCAKGVQVVISRISTAFSIIFVLSFSSRWLWSQMFGFTLMKKILLGLSGFESSSMNVRTVFITAFHTILKGLNNP